MADSFLDKSGLAYLWSKIKQYFVEKETGKGLSTNDYTDAEKAKIANALIPANSDLNDIIDIGWYRANNDTAASLTNCPTTNGFYMEVKATRGGGRYQHIVSYNTSNYRHWQRNYYSSTWGEWKEWHISDTVATREIAKNTDLDTLTDTGWYRCNMTATAGTLINCPSTSAFAMEVYENGKTSSGTGKYQRINTYDNPPKHYSRRVQTNGTAGTWQEWKLTDTTYTNATETDVGLMSAADYKKINTQVIPNGTDLNTITDIGWYCCHVSTNISTLVNKPQSGVRMYMEVMSTGGDSRYQHVVIQGTAGATSFSHWHRICYSSNGVVTWKDWVEWKLTDTTYEEATTSAAGLMSAADKTKLDGVAEGANVNVQADWNETDTTSDSYILNKPFTAISKTVVADSAVDVEDCAGGKAVVKCIITKSPGTDGSNIAELTVTPLPSGAGTIYGYRNFSPAIYGGTINLRTGEVIDTWVAVDAGTIGWSLSGYSTDDKKIFATTGLTGRLISTQANYVDVMCDGYSFYKNSTPSGVSSMPDMSIMPRSNNATVYFRDARYSTAADFKTAMSGKMIAYALAEPTTRQFDPKNIELNKGGTRFIVTTYPGLSDGSAEIEYITEPLQPIIDALS